MNRWMRSKGFEVHDTGGEWRVDGKEVHRGKGGIDITNGKI
jgi:hypothetical protein